MMYTRMLRCVLQFTRNPVHEIALKAGFQAKRRRRWCASIPPGASYAETLSLNQLELGQRQERKRNYFMTVLLSIKPSLVVQIFPRTRVLMQGFDLLCLQVVPDLKGGKDPSRPLLKVLQKRQSFEHRALFFHYSGATTVSMLSMLCTCST